MFPSLTDQEGDLLHANVFGLCGGLDLVGGVMQPGIQLQTIPEPQKLSPSFII